MIIKYLSVLRGSKFSHPILLGTLFIFLAFGCGQSSPDTQNDKTASPQKALTVYTSQLNPKYQQLFDQFQSRTGIQVNVVNLELNELLTQIKSNASPIPDAIILPFTDEIVDRDFFPSPEMPHW